MYDFVTELPIKEEGKFEILHDLGFKFFGDDGSLMSIPSGWTFDSRKTIKPNKEEIRYLLDKNGSTRGFINYVKENAVKIVLLTRYYIKDKTYLDGDRWITCEDSVTGNYIFGSRISSNVTLSKCIAEAEDRLSELYPDWQDITAYWRK